MRSPQSKLKLVGRFVRTVANFESVLNDAKLRVRQNSKSVINLIIDSNTGSHCQLDRFFFKTVVRCTGNTFIGYSSYSSVKVDFFVSTNVTFTLTGIPR